MYIEQHSRYQNKANNIQLRYDDKQFHTTVIKDVLLWIEHNLDQSLLLDDVANGNDSNLLIVFYVQIMPDDLVMQLHRF